MEPALIFLDITPKTPADQEKLAHALQVLAAEDAGLRVRQGVGSGCTVIGATSEAHLEQVVDRLAREFRVGASVGRPAIAYQETLTRSSEGRAKYVTHAQPHGEFASVALRLHPCAPASGYSFDDLRESGFEPRPLFGFEAQLRAHSHERASCSIGFAGYQPVVQGPGGDDEHSSGVGVPRRPAPNLRTTSASVPEPDDSATEA